MGLFEKVIKTMENVGSIFSAIFGLIGWISFAIVVVVLIVLWRPVLRLFGILVVPDDSIGLVIKKFVLFGANKELPAGRVIALNGEAGVQAQTLAPGLHFFFWPWQYDVKYEKFTIIPPNAVGVVESVDGDPLPAGRIIGQQVDCDNFQDAKAFMECGGQRGPQMALIPPGSWRINTQVFKVTLYKMTAIPEGHIGVVEAKDGAPLPTGRIIARHVDCDLFQDAKAFMASGQRGPQSTIIPAGQYRINLVLFKVEVVPVIDIPEHKVGVVTTKEGESLATGEIAGSEVEDHNMFQNPQAFIEKGGKKGLQEQVLLAGRYFINPHFATVEEKDMVEVPIANVGVVVAFVGRQGEDVSGQQFTQGNLVGRGFKGVWNDVLDPGKYPINPYTHKVRVVPTANVVLNWATAKTEAHNLDKNLCTITTRSADGFTFNLDVSQIIHIPRNDAPRVIARFGDMQALVTQVLEPMIGNYFRNAAQSYDVISFLKNRKERQQEARQAISEALREYNVQAVDTLIGDINPPPELMKTLTDRKLAEQEQVTFDTQRLAQGKRQELEQAKALANTQAQVVDAERKVTIADFDAQSAVKRANGEAQAKTINAAADAEVTKVTGEAEAGKILAIGQSEATVIKQKIDSMESGNYAVVQVAEALSRAGSEGMKIVPDVLVAGGNASGAGGGTLVDVLLANLVRDGMSKPSKQKAEATTA